MTLKHILLALVVLTIPLVAALTTLAVQPVKTADNARQNVLPGVAHYDVNQQTPWAQ